MLDNTQERIERSIFEAIRLILVEEGYLPDITDPSFTNNQAAWDVALKSVETVKGFAAEVFGHSSSLDKGMKKTARIAIIPRRLMPGDIGSNIAGGFAPDPNDPDKTNKLRPAQQSMNFQVDINIVSGKSDQDRTLHAVLAKALSTWSFVPMYDNPPELFFVRQFNFYDLPDNINGIEEKVYSYEIPDLYLYEGKVTKDIALIKNITVNISVPEIETILARDGTFIGPYESGDVLYMDLSGIHYKLP